jgi:hypothetical protein
MRIDHVLYAVSNLDDAAARWAADFGLRSVPGGVHPRWGTANRIVPLGGAYLELIGVDGELKLVALARRIDGGASQTFAAAEPWQKLLPQNEWVFLAATFDFDTGAMVLYRNGKALDGKYVVAGDPWQLDGEPEPDLASATDPRGIKIGGSYPQNTREGNACNCRMDSLMFLDRVAKPWEVHLQYHWMKG